MKKKKSLPPGQLSGYGGERPLSVAEMKKGE